MNQDEVKKNEENVDPTPELDAKAEGEQAGTKSKEEELKQEILYLRAEFDNYRKRILRDQDTAIKFANEKMVRELMSVVDLFARATQAAEPLKNKLSGNELKNDVSAFVIGVEMTEKELLQTLNRIGVEFIGSKGEAFDPGRHEAISELEVENPDEVGKVIQVAQRGCLYGGRLIKPAQVIVGKAKS